MIQYSKNMQIFSLIAYSLAFIVSLLIKKYYSKHEDKDRHLPLYIIGIVIIILEIGKQGRNILGYNYRNIFATFRGITGKFDAYALPFHFCSFFIFWLILQLIFSKNQKISHIIDNMSFLWSTIVVLLILVYPDMIYGGDVESLINGEEILHTIYFHWLVILYWTIDLLLQVYEFKINEIYQAPLCMIFYGLLAIPAAHIFKKNYCSIYSCEGWSFLEGVFNKGYFIYDGLLIIIGIILSTTIYLAICGIEKIRKYYKNNKLSNYGYYIFALLFITLFVISAFTNYTLLMPLYSIYIILIYIISFIPATISLFNKNKTD